MEHWFERTFTFVGNCRLSGLNADINSTQTTLCRSKFGEGSYYVAGVAIVIYARCCLQCRSFIVQRGECPIGSWITYRSARDRTGDDAASEVLSPGFGRVRQWGWARFQDGACSLQSSCHGSHLGRAPSQDGAIQHWGEITELIVKVRRFLARRGLFTTGVW